MLVGGNRPLVPLYILSLFCLMAVLSLGSLPFIPYTAVVADTQGLLVSHPVIPRCQCESNIGKQFFSSFSRGCRISAHGSNVPCYSNARQHCLPRSFLPFAVQLFRHALLSRWKSQPILRCWCSLSIWILFRFGILTKAPERKKTKKLNLILELEFRLVRRKCLNLYIFLFIFLSDFVNLSKT